MNSKEYLNRARRTKARIRRIEAQIVDLRLMMLPSAIRYDKESVQSSPKDQMTEYASKLIDLEKEETRLKKVYFIQQNEIITAIEKLSDETEQLILVERYISEKDFHIIAEDNHYSESWVYTKHRLGLKHLQQIEMVARVSV